MDLELSKEEELEGLFNLRFSDVPSLQDAAEFLSHYTEIYNRYYKEERPIIEITHKAHKVACDIGNKRSKVLKVHLDKLKRRIEVWILDNIQLILPEIAGMEGVPDKRKVEIPGFTVTDQWEWKLDGASGHLTDDFIVRVPDTSAIDSLVKKHGQNAPSLCPGIKVMRKFSLRKKTARKDNET